ncbi:MAG: hypothetical protein ABI616_11775 [Pseudomonadota bacterium]
MRYIASAVLLAFAVCGCAKHTPEHAQPVAADKWLGQWNGPEGTFLRLEGGEGKYTVTIQNLDGPRSFEGSAVDGQVEFERDGVKEVIHATDGPATGMKWLADKSNCLTIRTGEGYCR